MAEKFWTTDRKKQVATVGLGIAGWHALTMGANPLNLPAMFAFVNNPIIANFSLLTVAGLITLISIIMIWTEY